LLQQYIDSDPILKGKYGNVLNEISEVYKGIFESGRRSLVLSMLSRNVNYYRLAELFIDYKNEMMKPEGERKSIYREDRKNEFYSALTNLYNNFRPDLEPQIFYKILNDATAFDELKDIEPFKSFGKVKDKQKYIADLYDESFIKNSKEYFDLLENNDEAIDKIDDPFINIVKQTAVLANSEMKKSQLRDSELNILLAKLNDVKRQWLNKSFVPDANSTLRLTYGYVRGYSPADATYFSPLSTITGMIEKEKTMVSLS